MIDFVKNILRNQVHNHCNEAIRFYEERLDAVLKARERLTKQLDAYEKHIVDLVEGRVLDRLRFERLAHSRARYRRKYVIHHVQAKKHADLVGALIVMFEHPTLTNANAARQKLQPLCPHRHCTMIEGSGEITCNACMLKKKATLLDTNKQITVKTK